MKGLSMIGGTLGMIGIGGLAGACDGEGSFIVAAIVFSIGITMSYFGLKGEERNEYKYGRNKAND